MGLRPGCGEAEGAAHKQGETSGTILGSSQWAEAWARWYPAAPAGRQLVDLVTDSSKEMNEAIVHLV